MQLSNRNRECIVQFFWHFFVTQYVILKFLLRFSIEKSSNNFYYGVVTFFLPLYRMLHLMQPENNRFSTICTNIISLSDFKTTPPTAKVQYNRQPPL